MWCVLQKGKNVLIEKERFITLHIYILQGPGFVFGIMRWKLKEEKNSFLSVLQMSYDDNRSVSCI